MRSLAIATSLPVLLAVSGTGLSVSAQTLTPSSVVFGGASTPRDPGGPQPRAGSGVEGLIAPPRQQTPAAQAPRVLELTADEAVRLAIENNLGIQIARFDPRIEDLNIAQARAGWAPAFTSTFQSANADQPNTNALTGGQAQSISTDRAVSNIGLAQALPWGGNYEIGWDSSRQASDDAFQRFSPRLNSTLAFTYSQSLLRGFGIDSIRQQLQIGEKNREIADIGLRETLASTSRTVRNSYWNLAFARESLGVQQQSLELARESLRNTQARIEIGTLPPIDVVEAESEVALREEAVIVAQANIASAEDTLRALILDPAAPDFWNVRLDTAGAPPFEPIMVDVDAAVRNALDRRTDLEQTRTNIEAADVNIRFQRNETLPNVTGSFNYGLTGVGGTQIQRGQSIVPGVPGEITGELQRSFGTVLGDLLRNEYPSWTAALNISYPIGTSQAEANLARVRLQHSQSQTQLRNQQLQVATQVRQVAREVQTNQQRVESTRASRALAERRLDAEQRKLAAGTSTSFVVFQAQRDLAQARNNELRAILDYNQSLVDLETVQEVPLR
jgi:HAE1 family hydrophobic/amphiphilic exporter-1